MAMLTALFDACVLHPAPLRDLLMRLAMTQVFRARWTDTIHEEWIRSVLRQRPELAVQLARTRQLMNAHVMDCLVTGYEQLIDTIYLPDPNDRHVLAAAITGGADVLVTMNLKDFPASRLAPFGIEAQHPDVFICNLLRQHETAIVAATAPLCAIRQNRQANILKRCWSRTCRRRSHCCASTKRRYEGGPQRQYGQATETGAYDPNRLLPLPQRLQISAHV
jgi:predicted nucleic acid-binding protein